MKTYQQFEKELILEKNELLDYANDIDELKKEYRSAPILDITNKKLVKYNKDKKTFYVNESDINVNPKKTDYIILSNPKTKKGIIFEQEGKIRSESIGKYVGQLFMTTKSVPPKFRHKLYVYFKKYEDMDFTDRMQSGMHGSLD